MIGMKRAAPKDGPVATRGERLSEFPHRHDPCRLHHRELTDVLRLTFQPCVDTFDGRQDFGIADLAADELAPRVPHFPGLMETPSATLEAAEWCWIGEVVDHRVPPYLGNSDTTKFTPIREWMQAA